MICKNLMFMYILYLWFFYVFFFFVSIFIVITIFTSKLLKEISFLMWLFVQHNSQQMLLILLVYCTRFFLLFSLSRNRMSIYKHLLNYNNTKTLFVVHKSIPFRIYSLFLIIFCNSPDFFFFLQFFFFFLYIFQFTLQSWRVSQFLSLNTAALLCYWCRYCLWMQCHKNMLWLHRRKCFYCYLLLKAIKDKSIVRRKKKIWMRVFFFLIRFSLSLFFLKFFMYFLHIWKLQCHFSF